MHDSFLVLLLQVDIADRVDHEDLAVLGHDPLAAPGWPSRRLPGRRRRCALRLEGPLASAAAIFALRLGLLLLHAPLSPVHRLRRAILCILRGSRIRCGLRVDARDAQVAAPGSVPGELDIAPDELGLLLPVHVQHEVVHRTAGNEEQTDHDSAQARAVPIVVVVGALPKREAIGDEVVVALAAGPAQDASDERQTRLAVGRLLDGLVDLALRGRLGGAILAGLLGLGALGAQLLGDLVGVQRARLLAVCLVDVVLRRRGRDAEDVVEGRVGVGFVRGNLVADAEDFTV